MIKSRVVHFLNDSRDIGKDSLVWNMIGSILLGFQSVVFLMVLNRTVGLALAGIFSIAYANANMFLTIGNYGMRYYQVSDVKDRFSFPVYRFSRVVTWTLMIVVSAVYVYAAAARLGYTSYKCAVILGTICFKSVDCIEDVYHGRYQQRGRLDVAAKAQSIRLILTLLVFVLCICLTGNLLLTVLVSMLFTALLCLLLIRWTIGNAAEEKKTGDRPNAFIIKETRSLLLVCFPLFCSAFLSFYVGNAPKYAIDAQLSDEMQACYGIISMPVFVITLLNNFIFNPFVRDLSVMWQKRDVRSFVRRIGLHCIAITAIVLCCLGAAGLWGIPVLSLLMKADLSPYKRELLILLTGGGFLGLSGILNIAIIIIRRQKWIVFGYGAIALIAFLMSDRLVAGYQLMGAAVLYLALMVCLCICFLLFLIIGIVQEYRK